MQRIAYRAPGRSGVLLAVLVFAVAAGLASAPRAEAGYDCVEAPDGLLDCHATPIDFDFTCPAANGSITHRVSWVVPAESSGHFPTYVYSPPGACPDAAVGPASVETQATPGAGDQMPGPGEMLVRTSQTITVGPAGVSGAMASGHAGLHFRMQNPPPGGNTPPDDILEETTSGPDLRVDLRGPDDLDGPFFALVGQRITYKLLVTNVGSVATSARKVRLLGSTHTEADRETVLANQTVCARSPEARFDDAIDCVFSVPPLGPSDPPATFEIPTVVRLNFTALDSGGALGDRTLVAALEVPPADPNTGSGPNQDRHVTTFTTGQPRNDSNVTTPRSARAKKLKVVKGTSSGDVESVEIGMVRTSGGARAAAARCRWLAPSGRLRNRPATDGRCRTPVWVEAKGTRRWKVRLRRRLPKGSYTIYSRAISDAGAPENRFSADDRNKRKLKLR